MYLLRDLLGDFLACFGLLFPSVGIGFVLRRVRNQYSRMVPTIRCLAAQKRHHCVSLTKDDLSAFAHVFLPRRATVALLRLSKKRPSSAQQSCENTVPLSGLNTYPRHFG